MLKSLKRQVRKQLFPAPPPPPVAVVERPYPDVELFAWQPKNGTRNFGDHLSHVIVSAMAMRQQLTLDDEVPSVRRMIAIGSSLHFAQDGDSIWGTGVNGKIPQDLLTARNLKIKAVRGHKTAEVMRSLGHDVPNVFGDPGLLIPRLFPDRFKRKPERDYIVVPNLHDMSLVSDSEPVVSPLMGWNRCVTEILRAKFVVASSLHGLIVAESFGIPARYVRLSETESRFKYDDYATGTGRTELAPASSIAEALDMGGHPPIDFDADALMAAFPYELWD